MIAIFLLVACEGAGLVIRNNEPDVTIVYPREGDEVIEGYTTTLRGSISDTNDSPEDLVAAWHSEDGVLCEEAPVAVDGSTVCDVAIGTGDLTFTLVSRDREGAEGEASVVVNARPNQAPDVRFTAPDAAGTYTSDEYVVFEAVITDPEDPPGDLTLAWTDESGAALDLDTTVDDNGRVSGAVRLAAGARVITLTVTDIPGDSGSAMIPVEVSPAE